MHIYNETKCGGSERGFEDGITNGADWYPMKGKSGLNASFDQVYTLLPIYNHTIFKTSDGAYDYLVFSKYALGKVYVTIKLR